MYSHWLKHSADPQEAYSERGAIYCAAKCFLQVLSMTLKCRSVSPLHVLRHAPVARLSWSAYHQHMVLKSFGHGERLPADFEIGQVHLGVIMLWKIIYSASACWWLMICAVSELDSGLFKLASSTCQNHVHEALQALTLVCKAWAAQRISAATHISFSCSRATSPAGTGAGNLIT